MINVPDEQDFYSHGNDERKCKLYQCRLCCSKERVSLGSFEDHLLNRYNVSMKTITTDTAFVNSVFMLTPQSTNRPVRS